MTYTVSSEMLNSTIPYHTNVLMSSLNPNHSLMISTVCMLPLQLDCDEDGGIRNGEDEPDFYVQAHMPV